MPKSYVLYGEPIFKKILLKFRIRRQDYLQLLAKCKEDIKSIKLIWKI